MALKQIIAGIGLVILFSIACFMFATQFITQNNPTNLVSSDPVINSTLDSFKDRANELSDLGENAKTRLANAEPSPVYLFLIVYDAFAIPLGFLSFTISSMITITSVIFTTLFGVGGGQFYIILGIVTAIAALVIVLAIIKAIRTGDSGA